MLSTAYVQPCTGTTPKIVISGVLVNGTWDAASFLKIRFRGKSARTCLRPTPFLFISAALPLLALCIAHLYGAAICELRDCVANGRSRDGERQTRCSQTALQPARPTLLYPVSLVRRTLHKSAHPPELVGSSIPTTRAARRLRTCGEALPTLQYYTPSTVMPACAGAQERPCAEDVSRTVNSRSSHFVWGKPAF